MFTKYKQYINTVITSVTPGSSLGILSGTPLFEHAAEENIQLDKIETNWIAWNNLDLTVDEKIHRRQFLVDHLQKLGYNISITDNAAFTMMLDKKDYYKKRQHIMIKIKRKTTMEAGQKFNRFTAKELADLEKILNVLPDSRPKQSVVDSYNNGFVKGDTIYQMIMKKIYPKINDVVTENFELSCGFILKANEPNGIHTDYWHAHDKRKNVVGPAVLIPLSVIPDTASMTDTHTIIFEQVCTDNFREFKKNNKPIADVNSSAVYLKETILSHCSVDDLSYLTVKSICSWEPGSFLYWDRRLLHSSDSFGTSGIKQKRCIVMFFDEK